MPFGEVQRGADRNRRNRRPRQRGERIAALAGGVRLITATGRNHLDTYAQELREQAVSAN
jgi:hypothetical protein